MDRSKLQWELTARNSVPLPEVRRIPGVQWFNVESRPATFIAPLVRFGTWEITLRVAYGAHRLSWLIKYGEPEVPIGIEESEPHKAFYIGLDPKRRPGKLVSIPYSHYLTWL